MKVAYISGPYSARAISGVVKNIRAAERVAVRWWHHGYAVLCPHLNTALLDGELGYDQILEGDLEFVRRADVIVMLPGWRNSIGATREHTLAEELGKKIVYE